MSWLVAVVSVLLLSVKLQDQVFFAVFKKKSQKVQRAGQALSGNSQSVTAYRAFPVCRILARGSSTRNSPTCRGLSFRGGAQPTSTLWVLRDEVAPLWTQANANRVTYQFFSELFPCFTSRTFIKHSSKVRYPISGIICINIVCTNLSWIFDLFALIDQLLSFLYGQSVGYSRNCSAYEKNKWVYAQRGSCVAFSRVTKPFDPRPTFEISWPTRIISLVGIYYDEVASARCRVAWMASSTAWRRCRT